MNDNWKSSNSNRWICTSRSSRLSGANGKRTFFSISSCIVLFAFPLLTCGVGWRTSTTDKQWSWPASCTDCYIGRKAAFALGTNWYLLRISKYLLRSEFTSFCNWVSASNLSSFLPSFLAFCHIRIPFGIFIYSCAIDKQCFIGLESFGKRKRFVKKLERYIHLWV